MKKILTLLLFTALSFTANAQFTLTKKGYVNKDEPSKNFAIIEMPGYTQQQLYSMVKTMITAMYISPKTVLSENEPINLSVTGEEDIQFSLITDRLAYNVVFQFKDGKIKFKPFFISLKTPTGTDVALFYTLSDGPRAVMKNTIAQCERVVNNIYTKATTLNLSDNDW